MSIPHQTVLTELIKASKDKKLDLHKVIEFHQRIKRDSEGSDNKPATVAEIWSETGGYLFDIGEFQLAELCHFMSNLYEKDNPFYIENLIDCYIHNKKFHHAVEFLQKLYQVEEDQDGNLRFWKRMTTILPATEIMTMLSHPKANLENLLKYYNLDAANPMTWMVIGYTLKSLDSLPNHLILANQALDNALALKYLN